MSSGTSWTRRQGSQYRRMCARPGCGATAAATLRFQPTLRQAWLVDLDETAARTQGDLCHRHASSLVLPRGWELHDERTGAGARAGEPVVAAPVEPPARRRVRVRKREQTAEPAALPGFEPEVPGFEPEVVVSNGYAPEAAVAVTVEAPPVVEVVIEPAAVEVEVEVEVEVAALEAEEEAEEEAVPGPPADEPVPDESMPARAVPAQFGSNDDDEVDETALNAVLDARTPLLQRAFRNAQTRG